MNKKKKILAIVLVIVVLLLGGASIYVATQLSTRQAVAPNAPESKPAAADCTSLTTVTACDAQVAPDCAWYSTCNKCAPVGTLEVDVCPVWTDSTEACTVTATATAVADCSKKYFCNTSTYTCQTTSNTYENTAPYVSCDSTLTPKPDCATALGNDTANPDTGVCYMTQATCEASCIEDVEEVVLEGVKKAFKNATANTPGIYTLTTEMSNVSKSQIYVYSIEVENTSDATAAGVTIKDSLKDNAKLTYMDAVSGCSFSTTDKELTCITTLQPDEIKVFNFRVKASDAVVNGEVISNTAKVTYPGGSLELIKDLTISTVVGCNHVCTTDTECSNGLSCDSVTNKCRLVACVAEDDCLCPIVVTTTRTVATPTISATRAPTLIASTTATPTILPETGIFDLPGIAAFGGGLLLAVVGILLAL